MTEYQPGTEGFQELPEAFFAIYAVSFSLDYDSEEGELQWVQK